MPEKNERRSLRPKQTQRRPGREESMKPNPVSDKHKPEAKKLQGKTVLITGGDSGIGKAVAILMAKAGADIAVSYLNEHNDARETAGIIRSEYQRECLLLPGDISRESNCKKAVQKTLQKFGKIDILVNNAAIHYELPDFAEITTKQITHTFQTNIFSYFWMVKYALPHLEKGACIINSSSVVAYRGSSTLVDYAATKGAIVAFTRSLALQLVKKGIRVNGVAPGPVWTPLIPSSFSGKRASEHGSDTPMGRAGEPAEIAPCYLFLASEDSAYITGQFLHPNGGEIINA